VKFKIRFADQIVGFFIVLSLVSLIFVIIMLGRSQRWFAKDISFTTILPSAGGLSKNMPVLYRGFTIGNVKDFYLMEDDNVEVVFSIHEEHSDRVKLGSMVEMMISPVGLGNQFLFHSGRGEPLVPGSFVPVVGSARARELVRQGVAVEPQHDDSISVLMNRVNSLLDLVNEALGEGSDITEIGKIMGSIQKILADAETLPGMVDQTVSVAVRTLEDIHAELQPILASADSILANVDAITGELNDPNGLLYTVLDTDEEVYVNLVKSLKSVSGILDNLDKTVAFIPSQIPQLTGIIMDLRVTLKTAEDVLTALTNNPLLRGGIPEKLQTQDGGTSPRDIRF
jgi:phospholipid/cholesterol/gamma-HCH transport system substrate-binding protein